MYTLKKQFRGSVLSKVYKLFLHNYEFTCLSATAQKMYERRKQNKSIQLSLFN